MDIITINTENNNASENTFIITNNTDGSSNENIVLGSEITPIFTTNTTIENVQGGTTFIIPSTDTINVNNDNNVQYETFTITAFPITELPIVTNSRWTYTSGSQVNPAGNVPRVRPGTVMHNVLQNNPMIELDRWCKYTNKYTATCHACQKTFTKMTAKQLQVHAKTAKHLTSFSTPEGATTADVIKQKKLETLMAKYPDFALVTEKDIHQNEIFEYDVPPEERHLKVNDVYCKVCRRKLQASQTRYYHRAIIDHQNTKKHQKELVKAAAKAESSTVRPPSPPRKISMRIKNSKSTSVNKKKL